MSGTDLHAQIGRDEIEMRARGLRHARGMWRAGVASWGIATRCLGFALFWLARLPGPLLVAAISIEAVRRPSLTLAGMHWLEFRNASRTSWKASRAAMSLQGRAIVARVYYAITWR